MGVKVDAILKRHETLKREKQNWIAMYQALAQYCLLRKQYFTTDNTNGPFLLNRVFDSTAIHASHMMASSVLGQILPNPFESFEFVPQVAQAEAAYSDAWDMMINVNEVLPVNLALPEAGIMTAVHEVLHEAIIFGIGALACIETDDPRVPIKAKALDAKMMCIAEDENGQVDTVYMEKMYTVGKLVQQYGYANCSERVQKAYDSQDANKLDEKVKVLQAIEPRRERNPLKLGNQDMPFSSTHIEIDTKHCLLESGFNEMPIIVMRFYKNPDEVQGRSPAMDAMPDIRALNKLVEIFERAGEMGLDPPKMVSTEDVLGAGKMPWGPGVNIPIHSSGRLGSDRKPIEPIITVQNPSWALQRMTELRDNIKTYFMLDILSDLSNTNRQTLGEAHIRNELRMFMTGPMLIRPLLELIGPFLDRCFNILLSKGYFGVVRGSVQDWEMQMMGIEPKYLSEDFISKRAGGLKGYRINFICPAARLMKLEEAQGLERLTDFAIGKLAAVNPGVMTNFDFDETLRSAQRLYGASQKVLRAPAEVQRQREAEAQQSAMLQEAATAQQEATTFKDVAKGAKDLGAAIG